MIGHGTVTGNHMRSVELSHFRWPWNIWRSFRYRYFACAWRATC